VSSFQQLCVARLEADDRQRIVMEGDLDMAAALELELTAMRACLDEPREIEIDLRDVRFVDSEGLRGLRLSRYTCEEHLIDVVFVPPEDEAQRSMFELAGL
jgi:anti-anti-sigma factor